MTTEKTNYKQMKLSFTLILALFSLAAYAQIKKDSSVFLTFENQEKEVNVNGVDAIAMLEDYIKDKTTLRVVSTKESAEYIVKLNVIEKNMGNRRGKLAILEQETSHVIFESKWMKGTMNAFYGYSGSRHAIGKLVKGELLGKFPEVQKK